MGKGQLKSEGGAPDFAKGSTAPDFVKAHERAHSKNTLDPAKGPAPDSGQTKGGSRQGGRTGGNAPSD
jgi:hypothetical protein